MSYGVEAALFTALIVPLLIILARRSGLIDRPGGRKQHSGEVPLIGGLAIYAALTSVAVVHWASLDGETLRFLLLAGAAVAAGLIDDRRGLRPAAKLALQFAIAALAVLWGGDLLDDLGDILGFGNIVLGWTAPLISMFAYVALMNAVNLIDGADGVAGGVSCVILCGLIALATLAGGPSLWVLTATLGAISGFLAYNLPLGGRRPLAFLGEAGSMLIGFALGWSALAVHRSAPHLPPIALAWVLSVPILDMTAVAVSRILNGRSPFDPGRDHLHHLLLDRGVPGFGTALAIAGLTMAFAAAAVASALFGCADYLLFGTLLAVFAGYGAITARLRQAATLSYQAPRTPPAAVSARWHATDRVRGPKANKRRVRTRAA
jgi:UDP-GlcNAc:undecaprenyl-phosphate GlcNAc-1-phosphate transferase